MDTLIDQEGVFVTIERPEFRGEEQLLTLGVDKVLVAKGQEAPHVVIHGIQQNETGVYQLFSGPLYYDWNLTELRERIGVIESNLLKLFSRNE